MKNIFLVIIFTVFGLADENQQTTFSCTFTSYATQKGTFRDSVMKFTIVTNDNNGSYTRKENNGEAQGKIIHGDKGLSFIEVSKRGNISTTTIEATAAADENLKAVHSKNILREGKLIASQYYGTCQIVDEVLTQKVRFPISKERQYKIYKNLNIEAKLKTLTEKDSKYVADALNGIFPSRKEMEDDMSIEGMILVYSIMDDAMKKD